MDLRMNEIIMLYVKGKLKNTNKVIKNDEC